MVLCMINLRASMAVETNPALVLLSNHVPSAWMTSKMETYVGLLGNATMSSIKNV